MEKIEFDFGRTLSDRNSVYYECVSDNNMSGEYYRASDVNTYRQAVKALVDAAVESYCPKCGSAGWVWGYELDEPDNDTATDTMTRYTCDWCRRLREAIADVERLEVE